MLNKEDLQSYDYGTERSARMNWNLPALFAVAFLVILILWAAFSVFYIVENGQTVQTEINGVFVTYKPADRRCVDGFWFFADAVVSWPDGTWNRGPLETNLECTP